MKVNRYTQYAPAKYNPRSLQELMVAPMYMRQNHDALEQSNYEVASNLAQVSGLDVHNERLRKQQELLNQQSQAIADQLQQEGFNNSNKSAFMKFNKDYQNAIGPNGEIGKIQAAKEAYNTRYKEYMDNALKKWDKETAEKNWIKHNASYTGFDEDGNISQIGRLGAPEKVKIEDKLKAAKALLGEQVVSELRAGNYSFKEETDGSLSIVNRSGSRIEKNNIENIKAARELLYGELNDPRSDWRRSIEFEGRDPNEILNQVNQGFMAMVTSDVTDNRRENYSRTGYSNNNKATPSTILTYAAEQYIPDDITSMKYSDMKLKLEQYENLIHNKQPMTDTEQEEYDKLKSFFGGVQAELTKNLVYQTKLNELQILEDELYKMQSGDYSFSNNMLWQAAKENGDVDAMKRIEEEVVKEQISNIARVNSELNGIGDNVSFKEKMAVTNYALTPKTSEDEAGYERLNRNVRRVLSTTPEAILGMGTIISSTMPSGNIKPITTPNDQIGVAELVSQAARLDLPITVEMVVRKGQTNKPEMVLKVPTTKDMKYDVDGMSIHDLDTGYMGEGSTMSVRIAFDETRDPVNVHKVTGLVQEYIESTGDQGYQFVESQNINITLSKYENVGWNKVITSDNKLVDPSLEPILREELKKYGVTINSTPEKKMEALNAIKKTKISR